MNWCTLDDMELEGKRVLLRVDINVPMQNAQVTDATRIQKIAPTVNDIMLAGGRPILLAHFGRPKGSVKPEYSLNQLVPVLEEVLEAEILFSADCIGPAAETAVSILKVGQVLFA